MKKIDIDLSKEIRWPDKCAYCNSAANALATTNYRVIDGFFIVAIRETAHAVKYPVCNKHKWPARLYGFVTNQSFPTGLVMIMAILFAYVGIVASLDLGSKTLEEVVFYLGSAFFIIWVLYLKLNNPVKFTKVKKERAQLKVKNDQYAEEFIKLNS
jgi:hypothetical protein